MIIDSHVHFDTNSKNAYDDLKNQLQKAGIEKCVLIINSELEFSIFLSNIKKILSDRIVGAIGIIIDFQHKNPLVYYNECQKYQLPIAIKIHPRISRITKPDFQKIIPFVDETSSNTIIVDSFVYGPQIESHIGYELAVFLAERYKERQIVIAHSGGCDLLRTLLITRPVKNIYYDLSLSCNYLLRTSVEKDMVHGLKFWSNRMMFGTDYPDFSFFDSLQASRFLCEQAGISNSEKELFFWQNAASIYGIRTEIV